jgi:hypothetical protein
MNLTLLEKTKMSLKSRILGPFISTSLILATILGITAEAKADTTTQLSWIFAWDHINFGTESSFSQTITPLNVPPISAGNADWTINVGNSPMRLSFAFWVSNNGYLGWDFKDVPLGSRVQNVGSANCNYSIGNAFGGGNTTARSTCVTSYPVKQDDTYEFTAKYLPGTNTKWWEAFVSVKSTGMTLPLGRIEYDANALVLENSKDMPAFNQTALNKAILPSCNSAPNISVIYGAMKNSEPKQPVYSGGVYSTTCPTLGSFALGVLGKYRMDIGAPGSPISQDSNSEVPGALPSSFYGSQVKPSSGGAIQLQLCDGNSVVTQVMVAKQTPKPYLQGLKFACAEISKSGQVGPVRDIHTIVNVDVSNSDYSTYQCPTGEAAVALNVSTGGYVKDISLTCAKPSPYSLGPPPNSGVGSGLFLDAISNCSISNQKQPAFLTGMRSYAAAGLDSIQSICTPFLFTPTPKPITKPATPSFSLINITGNKLNVSVNLGNAGASRPDSVYLVAPKLGILDSNKLFGDVSGSKASWSIDFDKLLSGAAIPLKVVGVKNGVESEPLEQDFNAPAAVDKLLTNKSAPLPPKNVKSRIVGTSAVITTESTVRTGALATSAHIFGSALGIPASQAILGEVIGTKVLFEVPLKASMAGKTFPFTIYYANEAGKSQPVQGKLLVPAAPKIPSGTIKLPTQTKAPKTVLCLKGSQTRTFAANSCPPGWKSA